MDRWLCSLTIGSSTAAITQLYPAWATAGISWLTATPSQQVRQPCEGQLISLQIESDGANGGVLQVYDVSGIVLGIDVSSLTAITDAQMTAAITAGTAKLVLEQNFAGSGLTPWAPVGPARFMKGLAARAIGDTGSCKLNMVVQGGYRYLNGTH